MTGTMKTLLKTLTKLLWTWLTLNAFLMGNPGKLLETLRFPLHKHERQTWMELGLNKRSQSLISKRLLFPFISFLSSLSSFPFLSLPFPSFPFLSLPFPSFPFLSLPFPSFPFLSLLFFLSLAPHAGTPQFKPTRSPTPIYFAQKGLPSRLHVLVNSFN